jgi:hypothetical protein
VADSLPSQLRALIVAPDRATAATLKLVPADMALTRLHVEVQQSAGNPQAYTPQELTRIAQEE